MDVSPKDPKTAGLPPYLEKSMKAFARFLCVLSLTLFCVACGGGGGGSSAPPPPTPSPTPPPPLTIAEALAQLEASGDLPILDRSNSVFGDDTNADGVRDDVETYIGALPDTQTQKNALRQGSIAIMDAIRFGQNGATETELRAASVSVINSVHCIFVSYGEEAASNKLSDIQKVTVNTSERFAAYVEYNKLVSGTSLRLPEGDTCE
jgi:hypothetical protein